MFLYVNGRIVPSTQGKLSVLDRGFLYGDGVFETLRVYQGVSYRLRNHLARLRRSARAVHLSFPWSDRELTDIINRLLRKNRLHQADASLRPMVTRGIGPLGLSMKGIGKPSLVILVFPFSPYPAAYYHQGGKLALSTLRKGDPPSLPPFVKSLNYLPAILARREADQKGAVEALFLTQRGDVCEGTVSNVFCVHKGVLWTPPDARVLPGITRERVLLLADRLGIPIKRERFSLKFLYHADECFITSTLMEVLPIRAIEGKMIGKVCPGPITRLLANTFHVEVRG